VRALNQPASPWTSPPGPGQPASPYPASLAKARPACAPAHHAGPLRGPAAPDAGFCPRCPPLALQRLAACARPRRRAGDVDTGFIPKYQEELRTPPPPSKTKAFIEANLKSSKKVKA
jgi:hypothetical protein